MPLSWNEIKTRAVTFSNEWKNDTSEDAEAKSFWDDFFNVFGISRRRVATFEQQVKKSNNKAGFIDLLWKGVILIEHKSRGKDLTKAYAQAKDYFPGLKDAELPRYILVSDFERFNLYDLEDGTENAFLLKDFVNNVQLFGFIAGYQKRTYKEQDPVNIEAAALMGRLHDKLDSIGYSGHPLELYLVRLLFCLFADDTNIYNERGLLQDYIENRTREDGSDLAPHLAQLFEVLNTPDDKRYKNMDESLRAFPYVNGKLFEERLPTASFDSDMRKLLLECCGLDWGKISPAIFGSLFQSVMNPQERRNLGAHYTSEKNILKVIKPLFLDDLWKEFESLKTNKRNLNAFHHRIANLRFLDPACGCGNFLIVAYRELRLLEIEIIKVLLEDTIRRRLTITDIGIYFLCDVDKFYGIEYEEFPAQIAQVAMWLMDHQMNMQASTVFGEYYVRLPLKKSATIKHANALQIEWQSLLTNTASTDEIKYNYILGNPPFIGKSLMNASQKVDMDKTFIGVNGAGVLDYVAAWYLKAAAYMQQHTISNDDNNTATTGTKTAFVSTNSISQGEQVGILWNELFNKYKIKIHFAHRTFSWRNEARGNAAVHVVIIGFANYDTTNKVIYEYEHIKGEPHEVKAKNINPYLVEGKDNFLQKRRTPISNIPAMAFGSMPNDGGHFIFTKEEKEEFLSKEPLASKYFRPFIGSYELINGNYRWCLWLTNADPSDLRTLPEVTKRIELVKEARLNSNRPTTKALAKTPTLFGEMRQPNTDYIAFPEVSSERRKFIPVGLLSKEIITSNKNYTVPTHSLFVFGILCSTMHMAWVRSIAGRLKSDYSYSTGIVYNNFPFPESPTDKQIQNVESAAQSVLDARALFPNASLADLYDPNTMPPALIKAHQSLDKAVDLCYRPQPFPNETKRIELLFELYDKYTSGMFVKEKKKK